MGEIIPNVRERLLDVFYGIYKKVLRRPCYAAPLLRAVHATTLNP
jgi:hypothetical protein